MNIVYNTPVVSIIIPVYNVSAYIEQCISSIMNQTYKDIECIIVDDATPDDSITKCEKMIASYDGPIKFSILSNAQNKGLSAARNLGTKVATGDFLFYLDSDDELTPDCIETLLKPMMEDSSIEMVQGNHVDNINGKKRKFYNGSRSIVISTNKEVRKHFYVNHHICGCAWNKLLRRRIVDKYNLHFKEGVLYEDRLWIFYIQKYIERMIICKDVTYVYNIRQNSITTSGNKRIYGVSNQLMYDEILKNLSPDNEKIEISGLIYAFCRFYCQYVEEVPTLKDTHKLYCKQAKRYNCWYAYSLLSIVAFVRKIGNPIGIMKKFHIIRWRLMELPDIILNRK